MRKAVGMAIVAVGAAWWVAATGIAAPTAGNGTAAAGRTAPAAATQPTNHAGAPAHQAATQPAAPATTQAASQAASRPAPALTLDLGNGVKMDFAKIPAGKFLMGSPDEEKGRDGDESPQHEVTISKPFFMGMYEVTQEQYKQIMGNNPSKHRGVTNPVENVKWSDAMDFCKKMSQKTGKNVHLPTEAQWEYACRAGTKTRFSFGDKDSELGDYAWYEKNSEETSHPVGEKKPNAYGLYDMHGNVWEWCASYEEGYNGGAATDPVGTANDRLGMLRGGGWHFGSQMCRSAKRLRMMKILPMPFNGMRVVVE